MDPAFLPYPVKAIERLFSKLKEDPVTGCFEHQGARNPSGHVRVDMGKRKTYAHIAMYCIANRCCILPGYVVRHSCHNGCCCNPEHLGLGTKGDNNKDRDDAGRRQRTWKRKGKRLDEQTVLAIKIALRYGHSNATLYASFPGLTYFQLRHIKVGSRWGHVKLNTS